MTLNRKQFLKYILCLYLLGVKGLQNANLDEMFSKDPVLREQWLCDITNRRDMRRFLRQVCACVCVCLFCFASKPALNIVGATSSIF